MNPESGPGRDAERGGEESTVVRFAERDTAAPSGPFEPSGPYAATPPPPEREPWNVRRESSGAPKRRAWSFAGASLRGRLLAGLLALLAGISLIIGIASAVALRSYLVGKVDDQLTRSVDRTARGIEGMGSGRPNPFGLGQAEETLIAQISSAGITAQLLNTAGNTDVVRGDTTVQGNPEVLLDVPVDAKPHTRDLGGEVGSYRVIATEGRDNTIVVTGLPLRYVSNTVWRLAGIITAVALAGLALAAFAGAAIVRLALRPLDRMAATARMVSTLPLDRGEVALAVRVPEEDTDPRTEVGQVGAALNSMLGHVAEALTARQESETRVRQFVADASHELRTPLAAIRGYAELSRRSHEPVPDDVAHAMSRVESQAVRMTGLVEDLLLLASLDSGRPIEREPVDLSILLVGAVSDAHAAGPEHKWRLDLPDEPVTVVGEGPRLVQVVVNLLANARAHTPPGTTVTVGLTTSSADPGYAAVTVVDDGPGIPTTLLPEVFERFARGDSSRSRAAGSTGLGLSIVSAVVTAHAGTVQVSSVPGRTAFTVRLPLAP